MVDKTFVRAVAEFSFIYDYHTRQYAPALTKGLWGRAWLLCDFS